MWMTFLTFCQCVCRCLVPIYFHQISFPLCWWHWMLLWKNLGYWKGPFCCVEKDFFLGFFTSSGVPQGRGLEPQRLYFSFFFFFHWLWIILNIFPSKHPHVWDEAIIFSLLLQKLLYGCKNWTKEQFNRRIKEKIISLLITCNKMAYLCKNILKV